MAITYPTESIGSGDARIVKIDATAAGDISSAIELGEWADASVQVAGTFGTATVSIEGSNDGTNWATLNDGTGANALSGINTAKIEQILETTRFKRVNVGGSGACTLAVTFYLRRNQPLRF